MVGKIKCFSIFPVDESSIYLDPDMLLMKSIPFKLFEEKADVFLLKRSFDLSNLIPTTFRKIEFPGSLKNKSLKGCLSFYCLFCNLKESKILVRYV